MPNLYAKYAAAWGVDPIHVREAIRAETYALDPSKDFAENMAVQLYRAHRPINRRPEAADDGPEIAIIYAVKTAFDGIEAKHILEAETEFCRKVGVL